MLCLIVLQKADNYFGMIDKCVLTLSSLSCEAVTFCGFCWQEAVIGTPALHYVSSMDVLLL